MRVNNKLVVLVMLLAILVLGDRLRTYEYASVPHPGETADEYSYGWLGISVWGEGRLRSWSTLAPYTNRTLERVDVDTIFDRDPSRPLFPIVEPWFDHPPFFGMITGGYAYLKGVDTFTEASVGILRRPMLRIAWITTILIFLLAYRLFDIRTALLSSLFYSVVPSAVVSSRLALMENAYIPLYLGSLLLAHVFLEKRDRKYWMGAIALAFAGMLIKLWAVSIVLSLVLIAIYSGKRDRNYMVVTSVLSGFLALVVFFLVGALYDLPMYLSIFFANSGRFYGASSEVLHQAIVQFRFTTNKFLTDGWLIAGWISLLYLVMSGWMKNKSITFLVLAVFSYLSIFVFFGSESFGWYKYPLFPFLFIGLAKVVNDLFDKPNLLMLLVLFSLPIGTSVHRIVGVAGFQQYVFLLRVLVILFVGLMGLMMWNKKQGERAYRLAFVIILTFAVWLAARDVYYLTNDTWFFVT